MTNARRVLFTTLALAVSAGTALAQPGPPGSEEMPPPAPADGSLVVITPAQPTAQTPEVIAVVAPQNEQWSNVSHINGQLVKVGERSEYIIKHKTTSISTNPIGWMVGFYGVSVTHALSQNVAVRGDVNLYHVDNDDGYEVGLTLPIYFKRVFSGPFIEGGILKRDFDTSDMSSGLIGPQALFGWHWTFDSGFNVAMALGAAKNLNASEYCDDYGCYEDEMEVEPQGYFRVGYAW